MPLYDYRCDKCNKEWEEVKSINERDNVNCSCGDKAIKVIKLNSKPIIYNYFSENLDAFITGPAQKRQIIKERGISEVG